jgi:predicted PurR-regulated permease PerM
MAEERAAPAIAPVAPHQITPPEQPRSGVLTGVVIGVVIVCTLYFGREVLIPITLAILLSFVLSPLMELLRRLWLPRVVAALFAVLIAIGVIIALGGIIGTQIAGLAGQVPQYQTTIETKVESLQKLIGSGITSRVGGWMHNIEGAGQPQQKPPTQPAPQASIARTPELPGGSQPVPVVITQTPASSALDLSRHILEPIISPVADLGIILVVAIFTLLQKEDLRDRLIRLFGSGDLHRTTAAMDDAGRRLTRYFVTQLGINCTFGVLVGLGLYLIGVPSPVLWGVLGALLRFVPYIGSYIAAALPILLAAAVGNGWNMVLWTALLYIVTELIMGQAVEPVVYGHSTGLSPFSVIIAAIFWAWMWGPIGLILSTPLTLCLVVLGRHVEQLEFLDVMLGNRPALTPIENFYQRILAGDPDEAEEQAERFLAEHALSTYYDEVALEGLQLAAADANKGLLAPQQVERINHAVKELVHDLADHDDVVEPSPEKHDSATIDHLAPVSESGAAVESRLAPEWQGEAPVLCVAGRGPLDEAASVMLAQLLEKHDIGVRLLPHEAVSRTKIAALDPEGVAMVCIPYLDITGGPAHLRFLIRRLRQRLPRASVLVGIWAAGDAFLRDQASRRVTGADYYVSSLREALNACLAAAHSPARAALTNQD